MPTAESGYKQIVNEEGLAVPHANEVDTNGKEKDIGYGRCAETFFYIWAGNYMK